MRDYYPLTIMRVENIVALIEQDTTVKAIALLPLSLYLRPIRLETITTETREYMLRVNFFLVWELYQAGKGKDKRDQLLERPSIAAEKITIFRSQWSERFLDSLLLLIFQSESIPILPSIGPAHIHQNISLAS
jgi:hypothetical protein